MSKIKEFLSDIEELQIRSEQSFTQIEQSLCQSLSSENSNPGQISQTIQKFLQQEKKKYVASKSQNKMVNMSQILRTKKANSVSTVFSIKQNIQLPIHISRIFNSQKMYPNVPLLQKNKKSLDSIYGAYFGFLIGDITGAYLAYTNQKIEAFLPNALLMNGGGTYNLGSGQGTDQTQLLFAVTYGLIEGKGVYNQNLMSKKYLEWIQSKPFNFSTIIALSLRELRKAKDSGSLQNHKMAKILRQSSLKNIKCQSNIGLIRILPLTVFSLKFTQAQFEKIIKQQLQLICPNSLVIETGFVYSKILRIIFQTGDHERAFYEVSKWIYEEGSPKIKQLWQLVQRNIEISSKGNMGRLKTSFTYSCIEVSKKQINFFETLIHNLLRGGDTDANCAIVMTLIGAIVGYSGIPGYFKQKIINSRISDSPRPRDQIYSPHKVIDLIQDLIKVQPNRLFNIS